MIDDSECVQRDVVFDVVRIARGAKQEVMTACCCDDDVEFSPKPDVPSRSRE